jgi:hypothetical protein
MTNDVVFLAFDPTELAEDLQWLDTLLDSDAFAPEPFEDEADALQLLAEEDPRAFAERAVEIVLLRASQLGAIRATGGDDLASRHFEDGLSLERCAALAGIAPPVETYARASFFFPTLCAQPELCAALEKALFERTGAFAQPEQVQSVLTWALMVRDRGLDEGWLRDPRELSPLVRTLMLAARLSMGYWEVEGVPGMDLADGRNVSMDSDLVESKHEHQRDLFRRNDPRRAVRLVGAGPLGPALAWLSLRRTDVPTPERVTQEGAIERFLSVSGLAVSCTWARDGRTAVLAGVDGGVVEVNVDELAMRPLPGLSDLRWAARLDDVVVALVGDERRPVVFETERWRTCDELPMSDAGIDVVRLASGDLLLWGGASWRREQGRWVEVARLGLSLGIGAGTVAAGPASYYALDSRGLVLVDGERVEILLDCEAKDGGLTAAPGGTLLVREGPNRAGRIGWLWYRGIAREISARQLGLEEVAHIAYDPTCRSVIAAPPRGRRGGRSSIAWELLLPGHHRPRAKLPWSAIGAPEDLTIRHIGLRLLGDDDMASYLGGAVTNAGSFEKNDEPVLGGLFDEFTFGALPRDGRGRVRLDDLGALHPADRPQSARFGAVNLPEKVLSPWRRSVSDDNPIAWQMLPILPPAFRPSFRNERGELFVHDTTRLSVYVLRRVEELRRLLEIGAPTLLLESGLEKLQRAVDAMIVDGAPTFADEGREVIVDDPLELEERQENGEAPVYHLASLLELIRELTPTMVSRLDDAMERDPELLSKRWPSQALTWRAMLLSAGVELVPLDAQGEVDFARLDGARHAHLVEHVASLFGEAVGPARVVFVPPRRAADIPWISVLQVREPSGARLLVTVGASSWPQELPDEAEDERDEHEELEDDADDDMREIHPRRIEIVCRLPSDTADEVIESIARFLWMVAVSPYRRGTVFAPGHTVTFDEPLAPGSALAGFVLTPWLDSLVGRLANTTPHRPTYLLAVGLTATELEQASACRIDASELADRLGYLTDVQRC